MRAHTHVEVSRKLKHQAHQQHQYSDVARLLCKFFDKKYTFKVWLKFTCDCHQHCYILIVQLFR